MLAEVNRNIATSRIFSGLLLLAGLVCLFLTACGQPKPVVLNGMTMGNNL